MAVDSVILHRNYVLAAAVETTTGTAETLDADDAAILCYDLNFSDDAEWIERLPPAVRGQAGGVIGSKACSISFATDLLGYEGSGLGDWTALLLGCGLAQDGVAFSQAWTARDTLTMGEYRDGLKQLGAGCAGNFKLTLAAGQTPRIDWNFQGVHRGKTDKEILEPTLPTVLPTTGWNTLTFGGTTFRIETCTFDMGNTVVYRPDGGALDGTTPLGIRSAYVTDQKPFIEIDPEAVTVATKDWRGLKLAGTDITWSCVVGAVANNTVTMGATLRVAGSNHGERNGITTDTVRLVVINDTFTLTFS